MNNIIDTFQIHLNSTDAIKYYSSNNSYCEFNIRQFEISSQCTIFLSVNHAIIPYSFYQINETNNKLVYNINGSFYTTIYITPGNYNINQLKQFLYSEMGGIFAITHNTITNKLIFTHPTNNFQFSLASTCFELLGFESGIDYSSTNFVLSSSDMVNLSPVRCVCIYSSFQSKNITSIRPFNHSILCSIPVSVGPYNNIIYHNLSGSKVNIDTNTFSSIIIKIADQESNTIDLNNIGWSMTLQIDVVDYVE